MTINDGIIFETEWCKLDFIKRDERNRRWRVSTR